MLYSEPAAQISHQRSSETANLAFSGDMIDDVDDDDYISTQFLLMIFVQAISTSYSLQNLPKFYI